ncbi:DUF294 nucleotidyltransferase-like domain-containing protein [Ammoniphilus sp. CFH 90114]|uniref:DUF294 nucleotidyltransferase-like domain-containing protein n=1 Tax=Ammoniphilus sp. CFH 90114 TaxID=2493665 RepID=UPI0013E96CAD|nr:DUF294 nucleotidyltransferase-like domain-containing protein [Ammoniphilus sp. CFH 90114]
MKYDQQKQFLQEHAIFQVLEEKQQDRLLLSGELQRIPKYHYVIHERQTNDDIFLLLEGVAKNTFINDQGEEVAVLFYHPGDLIGIISAITHRKTQFSVQSMSELLLLRIPHHLFSDLLRENLLFSEKMVRMVSQRLDNLYEKIQEEYSYHAHGLDTYPYRKKIGEIMSTPVLTARLEDSLLELARRMDKAQISSLVIVSQDQVPQGIVTQRDIIRAVANQPTLISQLQAHELMTRELLTLPPDAYFYEALLMMVKHQVKHIPITALDGRLEGIVTMRNLTQARGNAVLSVVDTIESQQSIEGLANCKKQIHQILESMVKEQATAHEMCTLITELNDRLLRRLIVLSEQEMAAEGLGLAPVEYCWLTMGSEGRREQTLSTDQDNAIIYQDVSSDEKEKVVGYFAQFAEKMVSGLERCGFPRCTGNVMATNARWCHSVSEWKQEVDQWYKSLEGDELRNFTIFLDFRGAYGQMALAEEIRTYLISKRNHYLIHRLAEDDLEYHVPLGAFGRIITDRGADIPDSINLKHGAVMHIVNAMRILSLHVGVTAISTLERLAALQARGIFTLEEAEEIEKAFNTLMVFRIQENLRQMTTGVPLSNSICVKSLTKQDYIKLKRALSTAKWVQQMIARRFHVGGARL